ncbi:hypothetical protein AMTRI_Chr08g204140 [Amborella trichopoda]|uniref:DUF4378 domain-containing protein n=1 Tax=Amborella trichopoda TaxID=13333 RepID=W1PJJ9_AMBTC|nr:uncharacterized protein LOC18436077 [Amborella trichopoda]ERN07841.1 hypothetical protein AMTR_s00012p00197050 [Amborella trichopoda]|eukprot:XP_006846166.1 uncharacterized protein LOC18436077 [Amborella trichopoda]
MAKQVAYKLSPSYRENDHPGCMWGLFQFLDLHRRHPLRRMISDKRHWDDRHLGGMKFSGTDFDEATDSCEVHKYMEAGGDVLHFEEKLKETPPKKRNLSRARMKSWIAEEMSKEQEAQLRISPLLAEEMSKEQEAHLRISPLHTGKPTSETFPNQLNDSSDICSSHTKEPRDDNRCEAYMARDGLNHLGQTQLDELSRQLLEKHALLQAKLDKAKEAFLKQDFVDAKELARDVALYQSKDFLDALEIFNSNREAFLKILQDPNSVLTDQIQEMQGSHSEKVANLSECIPKATKHKQGRARSLVRQRRFRVENPPNIDISAISFEDQYMNNASLNDQENGSFWLPTRIVVLKPSHGGHGNGGNGSVLVSSPQSLHGFRHLWESGKVANRLKDIKQKIKQAIKESRKEGHRISMDEILHRVPYGKKHAIDANKEMMDPSKDTKTDKDSPRNTYDIEAKKHLLERMKQGDRGEGVRSKRDSNSLGKLLSLPGYMPPAPLSLEKEIRNEHSQGNGSFSSVEVVQVDASSLADKSKRNPLEVDSSLDSGALVMEELNHDDKLVNDANNSGVDSSSTMERVECPEEVNDGDLGTSVLDTRNDGDLEQIGTSNELDALILEDNSSLALHEEEVGTQEIGTAKLRRPSPVSVLDLSPGEDFATPQNLAVSDGSELQPRHICFDEPDSDLSSRQPSDAAIVNQTTTETITSSSHSDHYLIAMSPKDEAHFTYVRDMLEASGCDGQGWSLGKWDSHNQPMNSTISNDNSNRWDHHLLFDCINEVLLEIKTRHSLGYCPLSQMDLRPIMPSGEHVLEKVWSGINWHLHSCLGADPTLESIVTRDLSHRDGWMDLRFDIDGVGAELESLILDDLIEETVNQLKH